jgi:RpiR family carbohydrate utilization transcriptional regulator
VQSTDGSSTISINSLTRIRTKLPALAAAEARVANWVMQQPEKIMNLSMAQVAQACGVSDTTVLRFCRNTGFQGYTDLKLSIARDLTSPTQVIHDDINGDDPPAVIARKVFMSNIQAMYDTIEVLDEQALVQTITLLQNARQILIVGVGTSIPIVHGMYNMLMRLGLNCKAQTDSYLQLMEVALLGPDDTLQQAKANGASTICITGNAESPITKYADVTLLSVAREARIEAIASRLAQMSIADALYVIVALNNIDMAVQNEKLIWDALLPKMF